MPTPRLIPAPSTPAASGPLVLRTVRSLPADLLRDASRRLRILALLACGLWVFGSLLFHAALRALLPERGWQFPLGGDTFAVIGALASAALYLYARGADRDPCKVLDVGRGYIVVSAALVAWMSHWDPPTHANGLSPELSWVGILILIFPALVPSPPWKTAVASLIAVSMNPVAMLAARARGVWAFPHATDALVAHYPDFVLVVVAVVIAHVVTGLGQQVARARELGSYQLGELIGQGGMGEVYRAKHRLLARPAAIKIMRSETMRAAGSSAAALAVKRFKREAEAAARLTSPHTVSLYDFGVSDDQTLFVVMELLDGMDLETLVRRHGPVPPARAVHILRQVCESLDEAHEAGLVHRDIKPANIHVGRVGRRHDFVKVLDFGLVTSIAGSMPDADRADSLATDLGTAPGTPAYMAPEMALGRPIDGRADIYAMGCVAYFLLTGHRVFEADTPLQVLARHIQDTPAPPSTIAASLLPAALERVVLACLAKSPDDRPTALEAGWMLAEVDTAPWDEAQASAWWREHQPG